MPACSTLPLPLTGLCQRDIVAAHQRQRAGGLEGRGGQAAAGAAVAHAQRAGVDARDAGVAVGAGEREDAAAALFDEAAAAADDTGEDAVAAAAGAEREAAQGHVAGTGQAAQGLVAVEGQRGAAVHLQGRQGHQSLCRGEGERAAVHHHAPWPLPCRPACCCRVW